MRNLAIIPARSGSKGLRDKNILPLNGKPLLAYSIEAAFFADCFDVVHVSTDSEEYADIARRYNADIPFLRSAETAADDASSWDAVLEVLKNYERLGRSFDTVTLLQPTSPLRTAADIRGAYQLMEKRRAEAVVSVCEADHSPLWCSTLPEDGCMDGFVLFENSGPRQALRPYYRINGAIYLVRVSVLRQWGKIIYGPACYAYLMPRNRSVDIDTSFDFLLSEQLLRQGECGGGENSRTEPCPSYEDDNCAVAPPGQITIRTLCCQKPTLGKTPLLSAVSIIVFLRRDLWGAFRKERRYVEYDDGGGAWVHGKPQTAPFAGDSAHTASLRGGYGQRAASKGGGRISHPHISLYF